MRKWIMPSLSQSHPFSEWDKQENSQLLPPVHISYVKENNKESDHYDHKHSISLHARKKWCPGLWVNNQASALTDTLIRHGSIKRHSDNGIIRTQVFSALCHRGKSTLGNNHQSSDRIQSVRQSRTCWVAYWGDCLYHPRAWLDQHKEKSCTPS